jgi:hypothetical protein
MDFVCDPAGGPKRTLQAFAGRIGHRMGLPTLKCRPALVTLAIAPLSHPP